MKKLVILLNVLLFLILCFGQLYAVTSVEFEPTSMQKRADKNAQKKGAYDLRVRYVKVVGIWAGKITLPLSVGDVLTQGKLLQSMEALEKAITQGPVQSHVYGSKGEIGVLYIDVDFDTSQTPTVAGVKAVKNTVGVIFHPYYLNFSLVDFGNNVLPIPRCPFPTFYENIPKPLLTFNPSVGMSYDRSFGTALGVTFETDLLQLTAPDNIGRSSNRNDHLLIHGQGTKSIEESFYRMDAGLLYALRQNGKFLQQFSVLADYYGVEEPLGDNKHKHDAGIGNVGIMLKLAPNMRLSLDTGYRRTEDRIDAADNYPDTHTSANEQSNRALFEWIPRPLYGFLRAAVWEDNAWLTSGGSGSYQRLVGRFGYAKEIPVLKNGNQTIGLELLGGGGILWGDAPRHSRFFGGNSNKQFLYDSPSSEALLNMPTGPLIRSFGEGKAGFRSPGNELHGGNAFWHVNLNLTLPIPFLSYPLIPDESADITDANDKPITLKKLIERQIDRTGPSMLAAQLKNEGMTEAAAQKEAGKIFEEFRPATSFMINNASLYSIKPLLMIDTAGMTDRDNNGHSTWLAFGGGVQVTAVIAKFELGYMYTLSGPTSDNRANVFGRIVFQNLF